jgi:sugar O-acyltransferase (sialic acid O-acetyltransferase NeuD family)
MKTDVLILGSGGHAKVLIDSLQYQSDVNIIGILDADPASRNRQVLGVHVIGNDDELKTHSTAKIKLVNALGSVDIPLLRTGIYLRCKALGFNFISVIHPDAVIAKSAQLGEGCQIMAGCIIQADARIGNNVIVNTGASVDHDCTIEDHVHLAPGSVISGTVHIGEECHIGVRAVILQNVKLGKRCLVGAGAVVIHSVAGGARLVGVPAREIKTIREDFLDAALE